MPLPRKYPDRGIFLFPFYSWLIFRQKEKAKIQGIYFEREEIKMKGYVHSIETFGTVDGPGIRYVVFTQGCPMRCLYCHNPDTWALKTGPEKTVTEILTDYEAYRPFLKNGGLTVTGGEPLMQLPFITDLFQRASGVLPTICQRLTHCWPMSIWFCWTSSISIRTAIKSWPRCRMSRFWILPVI